MKPPCETLWKLSCKSVLPVFVILVKCLHSHHPMSFSFLFLKAHPKHGRNLLLAFDRVYDRKTGVANDNKSSIVSKLLHKKNIYH